MSVFSENVSNYSRAADYSFVLDNPAFSDAVLVLLTNRPTPKSTSRRLITSVAQLWYFAAHTTTSVLTAAAVPASGTLHHLVAKYGPEAVNWIDQKPADELTVVKTFQVNSALLAASSPFLRRLFMNHQQLHGHLMQAVPGLVAIAAENKQKKLVAVVVQPHQLPAAEAVVRFMFSRDVGLTGEQQALEIMLAAEQLQVAECAEICQHYLQSSQMSWPVAQALLQLQHKHLQEQRQREQQRLQGKGNTSRTMLHKAAVASSPAPDALALGAVSSPEAAVAAITPALPVPGQSTYLQQLLGKAQNFVLQHFEDLEVIMSSREGREQLLMLPYDALRAILEHPQLRLASENTALLAVGAWLAANVINADGSFLPPSPVAVAAAGSTSTVTSSTTSQAGGTSAAAGCPAETKSSSCESGTADMAAGACQETGPSDIPGNSSSSSSSSITSVGQVEANRSQPAGAAMAAHSTPAGALAESLAARQEYKPPPAAAASPAGPFLNQPAAAVKAAAPAPVPITAPGTAEAAGASSTGAAELPRALDQPEQQEQQEELLGGRGGGVSLLQDMCEVLRLHQLSFTYLMHVMPRLPLFKDHPQLTHQLQVKALTYQAAGLARQRRLAAAAAAASSGSSEVGKTEGTVPRLNLNQALANATAQSSRSQQQQAALLQYSARPESCLGGVDFIFSFDPAQLRPVKGSLIGNGLGSALGAASSGGQASLVQRLLGRPGARHPPDTLVSEDHYFAGFAWNLVVAADGFVGISWKVVLPLQGRQEDVLVQGGPATAAAAAAAAGGRAALSDHVAAGASGISNLPVLDEPMAANGHLPATPNHSGLLALCPEVAVTFSISCVTAAGALPQRVQPNSGSGLSSTRATDVEGGAAPGRVSSGISRSGSGSSSSSLKGAFKPTGRSMTYNEVQFVPINVAWGFPTFPGAGSAGWQGLRGADGQVSLRCCLKLRE